MKKKTRRIKLDETATYNPQTSAPAPNSRVDRFAPSDPNSGQEQFAKTPFPSASGATASSPAGITTNTSDPSAFGSGVKTSLTPVGNSGTQIFGGYFSEEYLANIRGRNGANLWDEMRRSEAQISMLLNAIINPIKSANWEVEPYDNSIPEYVKHAELVKHCLFEQVDSEQWKQEALSVIPFGFAILERVDNVVLNHPKFGTFNGLAALAFRSQKTIENWQLQAKTGKLLGVNQYTYSDLGGNQFIPGEFLLVFSHLKEGDNYEGISALRPMLGAYKRKELYLKLAAIGIERYAIGTPIGTVPKGKEKTPEFLEFKKTLQNFTSHETSYITTAEGWTIDIKKGDFDASKLKELLIFENTEFANAVVGNFLALGMNGGGGAYALGSNLGEFFTSGIQAYADLVCNVFNRDLSPGLVKRNFGPQSGYPKVKCTGISDKAGKELAETIKFLTDARALDPDKPLKEHLRKLYKMPKPDPTTAVTLPAMPAGSSSNYPKPGEPTVNPQLAELRRRRIQLADKKYTQQFDSNKDKIKSLMQAQLEKMYEDLKGVLRAKYKSLSGSSKILAATKVEMPGVAQYRALLRDQLAKVAVQSIANARKLVPNAKNVKLNERIRLADSDFDALPPAVRRLIDAQSTLISDTQAQDIEKAVFFQFTASASTKDDIDAILNDVDENVEPMIEGSTKGGMSVDAAAGDVVAQITQNSAREFFFTPEVLDEIESFTFFNEDPVSDICQELNGTTFAADDPDLDEYSPPLHHNCKSRIVPNLVGAKDNPDIDKGGVSLTRDALDSISLCEYQFVPSKYRLSEDKSRK